LTPNADPQAARDAVIAVESWLRDATMCAPDRAALAAAVRLTARLLAAEAPGGSVEVRIPPFIAVQCIVGHHHTRGTPPNVVETDPRTWLLLVTGRKAFDAAVAGGELQTSGARAAEVAQWFPLIRLTAEG